jgi:hypothetical protein
VEESGREWKIAEESGREWKRVEESGREWKRVEEQLLTPMFLPTELTLDVQNGIDESHKKTKVSVTTSITTSLAGLQNTTLERRTVCSIGNCLDLTRVGLWV